MTTTTAFKIIKDYVNSCLDEKLTKDILEMAFDKLEESIGTDYNAMFEEAIGEFNRDNSDSGMYPCMFADFDYVDAVSAITNDVPRYLIMEYDDIFTNDYMQIKTKIYEHDCENSRYIYNILIEMAETIMNFGRREKKDLKSSGRSDYCCNKKDSEEIKNTVNDICKRFAPDYIIDATLAEGGEVIELRGESSSVPGCYISASTRIKGRPKNAVIADMVESMFEMLTEFRGK